MNEELLSTHLQELRRGTVVLACLLILEQPNYGYALLEVLEQHGFTADANTLYPLLRRLESQGLLTSEWREENKRRKRFYRLSPEGERLLADLVTEWDGINRALDQILQRAGS